MMGNSITSYNDCIAIKDEKLNAAYNVLLFDRARDDYRSKFHTNPATPTILRYRVQVDYFNGIKILLQFLSQVVRSKFFEILFGKKLLLVN